MAVLNPFDENYTKYLNIDLGKIDPKMGRLAIARSNEANNEKYLELSDSEDIVSLFLLFQSLSKTPHSPEVQGALTAFEKLIVTRSYKNLEEDGLREMGGLIEIHALPELKDPSNRMKRFIELGELGIIISKEDLFRLKGLKEGEIEFALAWDEVYDVVDITNQYIIGRFMFITRKELSEIYAKYVRKKCYDYIKRISPRIQDHPHQVYDKIADMVKSLLKVTRRVEKVSGDLSEDSFPPCIKLALMGVSSGQRNYSITILLTSFLSYARLMPSTKIFDRDTSFELNQEDIGILIDEIVPAILEAGDRCDPPFFKEQPLEKMNIFYHLGFGMTDRPASQDFGRSKWYLPPSCAKVAENAPYLCQPDEFCKKVTWGIKDRKTVDELLKRAKEGGRQADGERVLEILTRGARSLESLVEESGIDKKELTGLLATLSKNKLVGRRKVINPLIYYIRKKRMLSRK